MSHVSINLQFSARCKSTVHEMPVKFVHSISAWLTLVYEPMNPFQLKDER